MSRVHDFTHHWGAPVTVALILATGISLYGVQQHENTVATQRNTVETAKLEALTKSIRAEQKENTARSKQVAYIVRVLRCHLVKGQPCYQADQQNTQQILIAAKDYFEYVYLCSRQGAGDSKQSLDACIVSEIKEHGLG